MMNGLQMVKVIHQVTSDIPVQAKNEVNAYLEYGWVLINIVQYSGNYDGQWSQPMFILGHTDSEAIRPDYDPITKKWD